MLATESFIYHYIMEARAWSEQVTIPTYPVGEADPNPMFLGTRVYQGSSGAVYPYRMIHTVSDQKEYREYTALFLENTYLKIMILPELGGRIQMALDKTNDYHFVYYNRVIKPALVGLAGPWLAGGIEFNWPQHHRPTTFSPVEYELRTEDDGSATVWVGEWEPMFRTRGSAGFRLYPERAVLEVLGIVANPQPLAQTFLWWANPAVSVNKNYQAVFPPDVTAVFDHGKRDLIDFPIAKGKYYKVDYSPGTDISWYRNIPVPTSYMAYHSDYDFVGGYDHGVDFGLLHVANHHVSPGKKMWTWGTADFGRVWEQNLTDEDGPYIELMTGVFTDNQPDFAWLAPEEEKRFVQYFFPFARAMPVVAASERIVLGMEQHDQYVVLKTYATEKLSISVKARRKKDRVHGIRLKLNPMEYTEWKLPGVSKVSDWTIVLTDDLNHDNELLRYPVDSQVSSLPPKPAEAPPSPESLSNVEELLFWGRHIAQYRHATFSPEPWYRAALKIDSEESRVNIELGKLLLRKGDMSGAEQHFRVALMRATARNPNPIDADASYHLALVLWYQDKLTEASRHFYKATWNEAVRGVARLYLARIAIRQREMNEAARRLETLLSEDRFTITASHLLIAVYRNLGCTQAARKAMRQALQRFPINHLCQAEALLCSDETLPSVPAGWREKSHLIIELMIAYGHSGLYRDAVNLSNIILDSKKISKNGSVKKVHSLLHYLRAYYLYKIGQDREASEELLKAENELCVQTFPNQLELVLALEELNSVWPDTFPGLCYHLGNYYYAHGDGPRAMHYWEKAASRLPNVSVIRRNLALGHYNIDNDSVKAFKAMKEALRLAPNDGQILQEFDVLSHRCRVPPLERLRVFEAHHVTVIERDDLVVVYASLLNLVGRHEDAKDLMVSRTFHPWEGGEGSVAEQYRRSLIECAKSAVSQEAYNQALSFLEEAYQYPLSLGEGKLPTADADNEIHFLRGCVFAALGDKDSAAQAFHEADTGDEEPLLSLFYNDRPAEALFYQGMSRARLGNAAGAARIFRRLLEHGEAHREDSISLDFFAVSLPDFASFPENLTQRNHRLCRYLIALGSWGLGDTTKAKTELTALLEMDPSDSGATFALSILKACENGKSDKGALSLAAIYCEHNELKE